MPITLNGDTGIQTPMYNGTITANAVTPSVNMKNRIINGAMTIDQRNAGASVTPSGDPVYTLDRWYITQSQNSKFSIQQNAGSVTPPVGFSRYLGATVVSAVSVGASDFFALAQGIEGFNIADLNWGSANAKTVTLSFQVYSSLTGTFGGALRNTTGNLSYPFTYTISSANTWTAVSVTIAGPTSGTWNTNNSEGVTIRFGLGAGSTWSGTAGAWATGNYFSATGATSVVATNGATFYITGVQLEVGSTATSFDYRPIGTELALCQRYYERNSYSQGGSYDTVSTGFVSGATTLVSVLVWKVTKRTLPTVTASAANTFRINGGGNADNTCSDINFVSEQEFQTRCNADKSGGGMTKSQAAQLVRENTSTTFIQASAEL